MRLHVGCAMWSYAPWQGRYLPPSLSPRDRLSAYATWCNAVEGNTTFYATPAVGTVRSWAGQTSPDFRFVLKLPRVITHDRRLADVAEPVRAFRASTGTAWRYGTERSSPSRDRSSSSSGLSVPSTPNGCPSTPPCCSGALPRATPNEGRGRTSRGCPAGRRHSPPTR